jgi:hypothetical protein
MATIDKGILVGFFRESLRELGEGKYGDLMDSILHKLVSSKIISFSRPDRIQQYHYQIIMKDNPEIGRELVECYAELLFRGIIVPQLAYPVFVRDDGWNWYRLTGYGQQWIKSDEEPFPEDEQGYVRFLRAHIQRIDGVILQYCSEAIRTYNTQNVFASAVMLGAASEKLFYLVADSLKNSTQDDTLKRKFDELINDIRNIGKLRELVTNNLDRLVAGKKSTIPHKVHEACKDSLISLFNAIRIQRNNAVHPIFATVSKGQLRLLLLSFPHACKKAYDLIFWFSQNKI